MENTFLPNKYELPKASGNYMRLEKGENKFRVMSSAIVGYEYWTNENKPVRSPEPFRETLNIKIDGNGKKSIKHFWAFVVWNYKAKQIQILELTQSTIMGAIEALVKNEDWGDPKNYDITISRVGDGMETEYATMPSPHKTAPVEATQSYADMTIHIKKLYTGDDPFEAEAKTNDININEIPL